jgi:hypothetical protein
MSDERLRDPDLLAAIERWKDADPPLDPEFEARVLAALEEEVRNPHPVPLPQAGEGTTWTAKRFDRPQASPLPRERERDRVRVPHWLLAAGLAFALFGGGYLFAVRTGFVREAPSSSSGTMLIAYDALGEVRAAEEQHRRALVRLQEAARPVLARAEDTTAPAREAALLLSYRARLRYLDTTIAEVVERVEENPYNAKGRAVLLAAYREKADILREVVALAESPASIGGA